MAARTDNLQAAVIGAGVAGLATAAVLARRFARVWLIEQDADPAGEGARKGIPQAAHVHTLLQAGRDALERLFPGFSARAVDAGALELRARSQWRTYTAGHWTQPIDTGPRVLSQTRGMLDRQLFTHVLNLPQVVLVRGKVVGVEQTAEDAKLALSFADPSGPAVCVDLVVDASGRGNHGDRWLAMAGRSAPPAETAFPEVRYCSALFSRSALKSTDVSGWLHLATAPATRGAVLAPVEGGRWIVTLTDRFAANAEVDRTSFQSRLQDLSDGRIAALVGPETMLSEIATYRIAGVRFKRFDMIPNHLPAGYLPLGDALATFNPLYAHGMTVALLQAEALGKALATNGFADGWRHQLRRAYLDAAMRPARWAWLLGQAVDLNYRQFQGDIAPEARTLNKTLRLAFARSISRPEVMRQVDQVLHLLEPPETLERFLFPPSKDCTETAMLMTAGQI
ncbi:MAG: FAD-dependent oxidoreductase [Paracoccaceae bacterium]